jgi:hypothetical protein
MRRTAAALAMLAVGAVGNAQAQEGEKELGWFFTGEFSTVWTGGNQESFTLGVGSVLDRIWEISSVKFEGGGVRTESSLKTRTAVGTGQDDFVVTEEKSTETTAEVYYARGRYDYDLSERFFLLGGVDWLRNTFAGIDSRFLIGLGAGNIWTDTEELLFKTSYSLTYTFQEDVVENPFVEPNFPGLRLAYELVWTLTGTATFESDLIADWNLDNTDDLRLGFRNALPIAISSVLALKPSLNLLWRNDPSLAAVPLFDPGGGDTGRTVLAPLEKLDTFFTLALVVKL